MELAGFILILIALGALAVKGIKYLCSEEQPKQPEPTMSAHVRNHFLAGAAATLFRVFFRR